MQALGHVMHVVWLLDGSLWVCLVGCMRWAWLSHLIHAYLGRVGLRKTSVFGGLYVLGRVEMRGCLVACMYWATLRITEITKDPNIYRKVLEQK